MKIIGLLAVLCVMVWSFVRAAFASHVRGGSYPGALCYVVTEGATGATVRLIPANQDAKGLLDTFFTAHGSKTTVALTQEDAGRDGVGQTSEAYTSIKAVYS